MRDGTWMEHLLHLWKLLNLTSTAEYIGFSAKLWSNEMHSKSSFQRDEAHAQPMRACLHTHSYRGINLNYSLIIFLMCLFCE